jgi:two-component system LytT family response regulator
MKSLDNNLRCAVLDDEPLAIALIADYIKKTDGLTLVSATSTPMSTLEYVKAGKVDLIFLDIQMPEIDGLQFMKLLQNRVSVIIVSAYGEYALEGFERNVVDYLLKPVMMDRFLMAVERAQERQKIYAQNKSGIGQRLNSSSIFIKVDYRMINVNLDELIYLEGAGDYVIVNTKSDQLITSTSLRSLEMQLPDNEFVRVHKSFIIALNKIQFIEKSRISIGGQMIPVSDTYKKKLFNMIGAEGA